MDNTKNEDINILLYSLFFSFMFNYFNDYSLIIVMSTIIFYFYKQIKNKKDNNQNQNKNIVKIIKTDDLSITSEGTLEENSESSESSENSEKVDNNVVNDDINNDDDDDDDNNDDDNNDDDNNDDDENENDDEDENTINQIDIMKLLGNYENLGDSGIMELKNKMKELDKLVELYKTNPSILEEFSIVK